MLCNGDSFRTKLGLSCIAATFVQDVKAEKYNNNGLSYIVYSVIPKLNSYFLYHHSFHSNATKTEVTFWLRAHFKRSKSSLNYL